QCLAEIGQWAEARRQFLKAIDIDPRNRAANDSLNVLTEVESRFRIHEAVAEALRPVGARRAAFPHAGLIWTLVRTDFKARYHGTLGGFVWALLKRVCMFVVLMGVFSFLFASKPEYKLNLIVGLFLWDFFGEGTKSGLLSLHARGFLLSKARAPSWILVVTAISNALITLGVFSLVIVVFLATAG